MLRPTLILLAAGLSGLAILPPHAPAAPAAPGPGAVIAMHRQLFSALDASDVERALSYLSKDLQMERPLGKRPCTAFLVDSDGSPLSAEDHAATRALFRRWAEQPGDWKTVIRSGNDDCHSQELSWCTLRFERRGTVDGEEVVRRFRSTALVTYDRGWKLTHLHVSPGA